MGECVSGWRAPQADPGVILHANGAEPRVVVDGVLDLDRACIKDRQREKRRWVRQNQRPRNIPRKRGAGGGGQCVQKCGGYAASMDYICSRSCMLGTPPLHAWYSPYMLGTPQYMLGTPLSMLGTPPILTVLILVRLAELSTLPPSSQ